MYKKLVVIIVFGLLIANFALQAIAEEINNQANSQQIVNSGPYVNGDIHKLYDFDDSRVSNPLFPKEFTLAPVSFNNDIIEIIEQIDEDMIFSYIENLTSFGPRVTATQACVDAGKYLYQEFQDMNLSVRYHNWSYAPDYYGSNIEATLPGNDPESDYIFLICAHYDSAYGSPGADDDGSGVATVLSSANILSKYSFNHTIRFVLFDGEEQGFHGSYYYVEQAYNRGDHIVGTFNVDSVSYVIDDINRSKVKILGNEESEWLANYSEDISQIYYDYINLEIIKIISPHGMSDHTRFWQFGYDAIQSFESEDNPYMHTPEDIIENCNMTYAKCISRLVLATIVDLAQTFRGEQPIDIPVWEIGDKWTYHFDIYADFGVYWKDVAYGTSNKMVYKVVDDSGSDYKLKFKGKFSGWIEASIATIRISRLTGVKGELVVQKSNLAVKEWNIKINGVSFLMLGKIPIPFPIPLQLGINVQLSPGYQILPFPLYDGKHGILPDSTLNHSGYIKLLFGILFNYQNEWMINSHDHPFRCEKEKITVYGGTFDTYKVTTGYINHRIENYYAAEVGNIVKQEIWIVKEGFPDQPYLEIKQELRSTTYEE